MSKEHEEGGLEVGGASACGAWKQCLPHPSVCVFEAGTLQALVSSRAHTHLISTLQAFG